MEERIELLACGAQMKRAVWVFLAFAVASACERDDSADNKHRLRLVVENISVARGWAATDSTAKELAWLVQNAAWDVDAAAQMLTSALVLEQQGATSSQITAALRSGLRELENVTPQQIHGRVFKLQEQLGNGTCQVTRAPKAVSEQAKARLTSLPRTPSGVSNELAARVQRLRSRAAKVRPFFHASCEGPSPVLFGWLDGVSVPLPRLLDGKP